MSTMQAAMKMALMRSMPRYSLFPRKQFAPEA